MLLEPDEQLHAILAREAANQPITMLLDSADEIRGYASVELPFRFDARM
jgi:hypothetical protein